MDKAGNFIGWLHIDGANLSVLLVEHALSKVHFTAERSAYYKSLLSAEEAAKQKKEKVSCGTGPGGKERLPSLSLPSRRTSTAACIQQSASVPHRQLSDSGWCWCQTPRQQPHAEAGPGPSLSTPVHHPSPAGPGTGSCLDSDLGARVTRDQRPSFPRPDPPVLSEGPGGLHPTSEFPSHCPAGKPILEAAPGDA